MKYSSFVIALLLNVTFADALHLDADSKGPAKGDDDKKGPPPPHRGPPHHNHGGPPPPGGAPDGPPPFPHHGPPHGHHGPPRRVIVYKHVVKTEAETEKEIKADEKEMRKTKIKMMKESMDKKEVPEPMDNNPILGALQAGDELARKQKKEAEDKLKKIDMKSKVVPVEPAKMWEIDEAKPLAVKEEKPDPEDVKDEDDEKCKFRGNVDEKFEALLEAYKKASDLVEIEGYKGKWKKDHFEALIKEAKNVVKFVRAEETKLKADEGLKTLSLKDTGDVIVAQNHYGVTMLSGHISRILDEVKDFYDLMDTHKAVVAEEAKAKAAAAAAEEEKKEDKKEEEKKEEKKEDAKEEKKEDPLTPATNVQKLVDDLKAETDKLCKYDEDRCEGWTKEKEEKKKGQEKAEKKKKEILAAKGTDKDPNVLKGPGGAIPKTLEEIKAEEDAKEEAKEEEEKDKEKAAAKYKKTCDKCKAEELKKEYDRPKKVNERYDAGYDGKDIMHHSAEDAHDTTHDHYYPYDIYGNKHEHDFAPPPAKKPDHDKPMQEMYNPEDDKHGRVWKPTHDTSMNGNMKHEDAK